MRPDARPLDPASCGRARIRILALLSVVLLVAGVLYLGPLSTRSEGVGLQPAELGPDPGVAEALHVPVAGPTQKPVEEKVVPFTPEFVKDPAKQKGMLQLADGSYISPLNGAVDPPKAYWEKGRPYSPIVGKEVGYWPGIGRLEMYVHADGSRTTTMVGNATRNGKISRETVTYTNHPPPKGAPTPKILKPDSDEPGGAPAKGNGGK